MTGDSIGICVIGAGRAGMIHARNFASETPGARLVGLADPYQKGLEEEAAPFDAICLHADYLAAIDQPGVDAVVVATPTVVHRDIVVAAAEAGKHILCEKPMAMNVSECDDMLAAAAKNGVRLQIGFMRRFDAGFRDAKRRIDNGEIGDVVLVKSLTHGPSTPKEWMYDLDKSNGPLAEVNSHDIDTLRWFAGSDLVEVYAIGGNYRCPEARDEYPDFYDNVCLVGRFADGKQGFIGGAVAVRYGYDARVEIVGRHGVLFAGSPGGKDAMTCSPDGELAGPAVQSWRNLFEDAYLAEDKAFVECIRLDTEPQVTGYDGKMAVAVVNAGNRSIRTGKPVLLEEVLS